MDVKLLNKKNYEIAMQLWSENLNNLLLSFKKLCVPVFEIVNEPYAVLNLSRPQGAGDKYINDFEISYIAKQCEIKKPDVVSYLKKTIDVKDIKQTKFYSLMNEINIDNLIKSSVFESFSSEISFLNSVFGTTGYFVYLHYSNTIFRFSIGDSIRFEKDLNSPWSDDDELEEFEGVEDIRTPEELEAARIESDRKSKALDDKILCLAEELIVNKKFSLVKNKRQCIQFMKDVLSEKISSENMNVIELIAQKALHLYEFEYLPSEVDKLKDKDPRDIADQLGITLPKVKKLLGMI